MKKNFFLISNYLIKKFDNLTIITISRKQKKNFDKSIKFVSLSSNRWENSGRGLKYILAIILLIKEIFKNKNSIVFSFQANIYCILICKLLGIKIISRLNSAKYNLTKNFFKLKIFKIFF